MNYDSCFIFTIQVLYITFLVLKGVRNMNIKNNSTAIWIAIAVLWIACVVLGTMGHFVIAMVLGVFLMLLHMMLGTAKNGVVSKSFFTYPLLIWTILWIASFILSGYFGSKFADTAPTFTFLGFHPSFAPTVFLYWIGGQLTLNLGLFIKQDEWLSEKEWDDFCEKAKALREE